jgi:preprotein translocase subunit SecF
MFEIIPKTFWYDFVARRRFWAVVSFASSGIGLLLMLVVGPNWSIDFTGGTVVEMHFPQTTEIAEVREQLTPLGISDDSIQQLGTDADNRFLVRIQGEAKADPGQIEAVKNALNTAFGATWIEDFKVDTEVGTRAKIVYTGPAVALDKIDAALTGVSGVGVQGSPDDNTFYIRLPGIADAIRSTLTSAFPQKPPVIERTESVGPRVGGDLRKAGVTALLVSAALHLVYIGIRFDFTFAPGAIICLLHDVAITCGILVLTRQDFGLQTVSALLTLSGYSLNDTIVVYDRIRENLHKYRRKNFGDLINDSINQTLSRTIMTAGATALAMIPFLFIGGPVLREFATVMLVGIVVGCYSSVYVAAPLTMILRDNQDFLLGLVGMRSKPAAGGDDAPAGRKSP